ncbi:hypothetical protein HanXRQr2_Chr07g0300931 [Helianthus annuus]|uniref:Uncharacterized protein n=1 Tax=Helianthus annuus TaxID=4232 RepID=A0A9K3IM34_HELAN|nr:hypothetical protein HanXRQr2_Chr07g0300931 [Helianthus annuus]
MRFRWLSRRAGMMMLRSGLSMNMGWLMTGIGEMYKYMGVSVPPRPPPRVYPDRGSFYTQQPDPPCHPLPSPFRPFILRPVLYSTQLFHAAFSSVRPDYVTLSFIRPFHAGSRHDLYAAQSATLYYAWPVLYEGGAR